MGELIGVYRILVGKSEGKRPFVKPSRRWEYNIKMYVQEVVWGVLPGFIWLRIGTGSGNL